MAMAGLRSLLCWFQNWAHIDLLANNMCWDFSHILFLIYGKLMLKDHFGFHCNIHISLLSKRKCVFWGWNVWNASLQTAMLLDSSTFRAIMGVVCKSAGSQIIHLTSTLCYSEGKSAKTQLRAASWFLILFWQKCVMISYSSNENNFN